MKVYLLVNVYITMENHNFQWVNPLFLCAIVNSYVKLPEAIPDIGDNKSFIKGPQGGG